MNAYYAPHLWYDTDRLNAIRDQVAAGEPTLLAILAWARSEASRTGGELYPEEQPAEGPRKVTEGGQYMSACALLALFDAPQQRPQWAKKAVACYRFLHEGAWPSDLGTGAKALEGSVLAEACLELLDDEDRQFLLAALAATHERLRVAVTKGNPHLVNNNWWAITHGGCLLSGHAIHGRPDGRGGVYDCSESIHWARQRLHAFTHHFGDAGIYHEGLGYQGYALSMLLPALYADARNGGLPIGEICPSLAKSAASTYASVVAVAPTDDVDSGPIEFGDKQRLGMQLSWNDAGPGHNGGIQDVFMQAIAPAEQRGALARWYRQLHGIEGDGTIARGYCGMFFAALLHPYDIADGDPDRDLPRFVVDNRQGMVIVRSGYRGAEDNVCGVYARATHVGGHSADDAGSIRLIALGHDWMVGGGQARSKAVWQSVVVDDSGERPKPTPCGSVFWREATADGAIVALDLRKVHGAYSERHVAVDYSGRYGAPVVLSILDQIDDHRSDRGWQWNQSFAPNLDIILDEDGAGYRLLAADGAQLRARFLAAQPQSLEVHTMPQSQRTFANGMTVAYRPRRYVSAHFAAQSPLAIQVAMVVSQGLPPLLERAPGTAVRIGESLWERPFGADLPHDFTPGVSGGVCPYPSGRR